MKLDRLIAPYARHFEVLQRSHHTVEHRRDHALRFLRFLESRGVTEVEGLTKDLVLAYQEDLAEVLTEAGNPLAPASQLTFLSSLRVFLRWLYREDYVAVDLARVIQLPKIPKPLPKEVIEPDEMERMMAVPDLRTHAGYRNRAMMEVFYSTGIRVSELTNLQVPDVDLDGGYVLVRAGKGRKDRVVPLGTIAAEVVRGYLAEIRPRMMKDATEVLFLNYRGGKLTTTMVEIIVRRAAEAAGIRKKITPHCFRVTCTTGMLRNGANPRHLQEMLGHASVASLDPYTRLTINDLKAVHAQYHPRERLEDAPKRAKTEPLPPARALQRRGARGLRQRPRRRSR